MGFEEVKKFKYKFKRISSINIELIEEFSCGLEELDKKLIRMKENDEGTTFVFLDETNEHLQNLNTQILELESDLALIAVVGRGMRQTRGTAGRIFSALAHAHVNVKMIDQGSSELNIIIGVENRDFENAVKAIYDIFVLTQI